MSTIGSQLMALRERSGLTMHDIATAASYRGRSSVQKFFNPDYDPPSLDMNVAGRLARALVGHGRPPIEEADIFTLTAAKHNQLDRYRFKSMSGILRDVPVYTANYAYTKKSRNTGESSVSLYVLELDNPVRFAWHPPCYEGRQGIYAILVFGMPLSPRYKPGDTVFVDAAEPARLGDDVCVHIAELDGDRLRGEPETGLNLPESAVIALFGTYERQEGDRIFIRSFDGGSLANLSLARVREMTRLLSLSDVLIP